MSNLATYNHIREKVIKLPTPIEVMKYIKDKELIPERHILMMKNRMLEQGPKSKGRPKKSTASPANTPVKAQPEAQPQPDINNVEVVEEVVVEGEGQQPTAGVNISVAPEIWDHLNQTSEADNSKKNLEDKELLQIVKKALNEGPASKKVKVDETPELEEVVEVETEQGGTEEDEEAKAVKAREDALKRLAEMSERNRKNATPLAKPAEGLFLKAKGTRPQVPAQQVQYVKAIPKKVMPILPKPSTKRKFDESGDVEEIPDFEEVKESGPTKPKVYKTLDPTTGKISNMDMPTIVKSPAPSTSFIKVQRPGTRNDSESASSSRSSSPVKVATRSSPRKAN